MSSTLLLNVAVGRCVPAKHLEEEEEEEAEIDFFQNLLIKSANCTCVCYKKSMHHT